MAMKILLTNDDGIDAPGLAHLLDFAKTLGEVTVVAPLVQQSAKSQAIEIHRPFHVKKVAMEGAVAAYSVDSTPADCVRFAILGLQQTFDLVISGINRGFNVGEDIAYSGTVGAVFEASRQGHRAMALSADYLSFEGAVAHIAEVYDFIVQHDLLSQTPIINVNFPREQAKGIRITRQGDPMYADDFLLVGEDLYEPKLRVIYTDSHNLDIDADCVMNGYISITPLHRDNTHMDAYLKMKAING